MAVDQPALFDQLALTDILDKAISSGNFPDGVGPLLDQALGANNYIASVAYWNQGDNQPWGNVGISHVNFGRSSNVVSVNLMDRRWWISASVFLS